MVTTAFDACLDAYPMREWEAFEEALAQSRSSTRRSRLRRLYVGGAIEVPRSTSSDVMLPRAPRMGGSSAMCSGPAWAGARALGRWRFAPRTPSSSTSQKLCGNEGTYGGARTMT